MTRAFHHIEALWHINARALLRTQLHRTNQLTGDAVDTAVGKLQKEITDNASTVTTEISRVEGLISTEATTARAAEGALADRVTAIENTNVVLTASVDTATETISFTTGTIKTT